jgi:hypothetical protein
MESATPVTKLHITGLFPLAGIIYASPQAARAAPHSSDLNFAILRIAFIRWLKRRKQPGRYMQFGYVTIKP